MNFTKKSSGAYIACLRNDWLNTFCLHMKNKIKKPNGYWSKEKCLNEAKKYNSKKNFRIKSGSAYSYSLKNNWIKEMYCCIENNKKQT